jgi:hypothetical protein
MKGRVRSGSDQRIGTELCLYSGFQLGKTTLSWAKLKERPIVIEMVISDALAHANGKI